MCWRPDQKLLVRHPQLRLNPSCNGLCVGGVIKLENDKIALQASLNPSCNGLCVGGRQPQQLTVFQFIGG